jgi:hypothetical protein
MKVVERAMFLDGLSDLLPHRDDPAECLGRAQKCEEMAKKARTGQNRSVLLRLAAHWREMATRLKSRPGTVGE